jgi:acyl-CoA thioester hydrolase
MTLLTASCQIKIEFYDVDPMNVVWHGNYPKYLEQARSALLDLIDYNYAQMDASGYFWPVVELKLKYILPIVLQQTIIVEANLLEFENRLKIEYIIFNESKTTILSKATSIQVAVAKNQNHLELVTPTVFQEKVKKLL